MRQIVYVSSSVGLFSRDDLQALLTRSREKNTRLNITGLLLYRDGNIVQVLEGEEPVVRPLLEKIGRDPRHTGIIVLLDREVTERDFPEWSMGFRDLTSPEVRRLPGYSEFLNQPLTAELGAGRAHRLLQLFKEKM